MQATQHIKFTFNAHSFSATDLEEGLLWLKKMRRESGEQEIISSYILDGKFLLA